MHHNCTNCANCKKGHKNNSSYRSDDEGDVASGRWVSDSQGSSTSPVTVVQVPVHGAASGKKAKHEYPVLMTWNDPTRREVENSQIGLHVPVKTSSQQQSQFRDSIMVLRELPHPLILKMGDVVVFSSGISSRDNRGGITINSRGDTFTFETRGMYRAVLNTFVRNGSRSRLQFKLSYIRDDHLSFSFIPVDTAGAFSFSTILSIEAGTTMTLVKQDDGEIVLTDNVKLQIYSI